MTLTEVRVRLEKSALPYGDARVHREHAYASPLISSSDRLLLFLVSQAHSCQTSHNVAACRLSAKLPQQ